MHWRNPAALALAVSSSLGAQTISDLSNATPVSGQWSYALTNYGSEARFDDGSANPQLIIQCTRATRRVTISKPAGAPAPSMGVWTSSEQRNVAATFNPATGRLSIDVGAYDTLLDAISSSRGRFGVSVGAQPALVMPPWPELAHVVEDCRA